MGCTNVLVDGFSKDRSIYLFALGPSAHQNLLFTKDVFKILVLREKTFSLHVFKKEREKKNHPNKKENLKNILMDGLEKPR